MFLPSRALLPFSKYMWVNSISELRFFSLKPYSFPFQALQCWLLEQGNCSVWDMEQNTPGSQLPSSPLHIHGAVMSRATSLPSRRVTQTFLMDMDCSKPNTPTCEILSIFRAEQQLISQSSATAPPISACF